VTKNQILAVLENSASTSEILDLLVFTDTFNIQYYFRIASRTPELSENWLKSDFVSIPNRNDLSGSALGDIQPAFSTFQKSSEDLRFFLETDYHNKKTAVIEKQIDVQKHLLSQNYKQLKITEEQLISANKNFAADSMLFAKNVISSFDFESAKTVRLQAIQNLENAKSSIENQKISILQSEQTIFDLRQQRSEQLSQIKMQYINAFDQLKAQLKAWEQTYILRSRIDGVATLTKYWQKNQNVTAGETVLAVVPSENQHIIGKIYLPPQGAGKVKTGQTVNVKFDNFPYMEYGMIKVEVKNIALVPVEQGETRNYVLEVAFPEKLVTTYGKSLVFSQQMSGTAEIITDDLRLLERLLNPVRALVKNQLELGM
ncbi:MAG: HlyD family secretion protein, partial [Dysgonamonadaceae bacterium]|nr:HlyD family secretion protein [Dysgonamonadaceae bacterium]